MLKTIADKLHSAHSVVLSTHRHCDGDGFGAQLALFHALRKMGKQVQILNVDRPPHRYDFLLPAPVEVFENGAQPLTNASLALIFDTNDHRLVEPLFSELRRTCEEVLFIDHHPVLKNGPTPTPESWIDTSAASTGELVFDLIQELKVAFDPVIARALYTSIVFDTQIFRYVKSSPRSHLMAAELLRYERRPEEIHRHLFATYTVEKTAFLARALGHVEYLEAGRIAFIHLDAKDLRESRLALDESGDVIDFLMNVESVIAAALIREDEPGRFKISLRSKPPIEILKVAESLGGGGHMTSAGAYCAGDSRSLREKIVRGLASLLHSGDPRE